MSHPVISLSDSPRIATLPTIPGVEIDPSALELLTPEVSERLGQAVRLTRHLAEQHGIGHGRLIATGFESYEDDDREIRLTYRVNASENLAYELWGELAEQMYQRSLGIPETVGEQIGIAVEVVRFG